MVSCKHVVVAGGRWLQSSGETHGMNLTIRRGTHADAEIVTDYNARMAQETEGMALDREVLAEGVRQILADESKGLYFLAEATSDAVSPPHPLPSSPRRVIGQLMITFEWSDWRNGWVWWIQSVYVAPEYRRGGVFTALNEHVVQEARAAGVKGIRLYVDEHNKVAQTTYEKLGMKTSNYVLFERVPLE